MKEPLISLALPIKNGLPSLRLAIEALQRQTYRNFEVVVQDGGSTDGSLEYLHSIELPNLEIVSQADTGHGQAFNRAWGRCHGPLVCMLACDEFLEDIALETFVAWHNEHPNAAYVYGQSRLWKNEKEIHSVVKSGKYDLLKLLMAEYCPPAGAGFYNRQVVGADFYFDEQLKTCPDFDLFIWLGLRFGPLQIIEKEKILFNSIRDRSDTTFRPQSYDQIVQDKLYILNRFFVSQGNSRLNRHLHNVSISSTYCWLASLVLEIVGETSQCYKYIIEAAKHDPGSSKVAKLVAQTRGLVLDTDTGQVLTRRMIQPEFPPPTAIKLEQAIDLSTAQTDKSWGGASINEDGSAIRILTDRSSWSYAAQIPIQLNYDFTHGGWYWLDINIIVKAGQVGIAILTQTKDLKCERLISSGSPSSRLVFPIFRTDLALLIRNGSLADQSIVDLIEARIYGMPSSPPDAAT
jgi:glycosyltransferase involved in cell wall biosynthesis